MAQDVNEVTTSKPVNEDVLVSQFLASALKTVCTSPKRAIESLNHDESIHGYAANMDARQYYGHKRRTLKTTSLTGASHKRVLSKSRRQAIFLFTMRRGTLWTNGWKGFNLVSFNIGRIM